MDKNYLKELFNKFEESQEKSQNSYIEFYKKITTLSVGLIGLLIGLKANPIPNLSAKYAFFTTIVLIGLSILFSLISIFCDVDQYRQETKIRQSLIMNYLKNPKENNFQIESINKKWIFKFSEIATLFCLVLSVLSLIMYVFYLEF